MDENEIIKILNYKIFDEMKSYLIKNLAENPERFVGLFRSTTPSLKLLQNLLQSREIRFGDALEEIIRAFISQMGFINLDRILIPEGKKKLDCDQYFSDVEKNVFYLIEQKVRDDHDSTKKSGQIENFEKKLKFLKDKHQHIVGIMYFIDPSHKKTKLIIKNL